MSIDWHTIIESDNNVPAVSASLKEKATLIGRVGLMMLSVGTGAWRVRNSMNTIARNLGVTCSADIGLLAITWTCAENNEMLTQSMSIPTTGVNTDKLMELELFIKEFPKLVDDFSVDRFHKALDQIRDKAVNYSAWQQGLAAALACGAFTFLLGGGIIEMICAFLGAGAGNFVRNKMLRRKISLFANVSAGVATACIVYVLAILLSQRLFNASVAHQAGYICAMLFVIPGFPLITGGIDLAKLDLRSGLERITYALLIITVATMTGWVTAMAFSFEPADFAALNIPKGTHAILRIVASFFGVYNFSIMFNSPRKMALTAGLIGMITNTLRLELIDMFPVLTGTEFPIGVAAFVGAFCTGCIASVVKRKIGFPRISLTVPAIVIMVPGLFMYRGIYLIGLNQVSEASVWLVKAALVVIALPLGLVFARLCTDSNFRKCT